MIHTAYFLEKAEQCFRLGKTPGVPEEVSRELYELGQDLMAKAVYFDTLRKRAEAAAPVRKTS